MRTRRHRSRKSHRKAHRKSRRVYGAGYQTSQQFFNPDQLQPYTSDAGVSTAPNNAAIRPILNSTFKGGRRLSGGFSPSIMGSFLQNAQQAVVPLALYSAYQLMPKKARNILSPKRRSSRK